MLRRAHAEEFDSVYHLMERSFPRDEYRPYPQQRALLDRQRYQLWLMTEPRSGLLTAFAAVWDLDDVLFIEHIAVEPRFRGQGLGSRVLAELKEHFGKRLLLEVEPAVDQLTRRRIAFYQRSGFVLNHHPYLMPALAPGQQPVPLLLMSSPDPISPADFPRVRDLLYQQVYCHG